MLDLKNRFDEAVALSKSLTKRPDNSTLLKIYAYFKQATEGDVKGERPDMFDAVGTAKYDAWEALEGKSRDEVMQAYVDLITKLKAS